MENEKEKSIMYMFNNLNRVIEFKKKLLGADSNLIVKFPNNEKDFFIIKSNYPEEKVFKQMLLSICDKLINEGKEQINTFVNSID